MSKSKPKAKPKPAHHPIKGQVPAGRARGEKPVTSTHDDEEETTQQGPGKAPVEPEEPPEPSPEPPPVPYSSLKPNDLIQMPPGSVNAPSSIPGMGTPAPEVGEEEESEKE